MKNTALLVTFLCLGLWIGCSPNCPSDVTLLNMSKVEKWACLKKGMPEQMVFRIIGSPLSSRSSKNSTVYTFDCFLCTATFDSTKQLAAWHGPKK